MTDRDSISNIKGSLFSLMSDVLIVLLCSLAILGLLFRQLNISVPVDPLEWQISQDTANSIVAWFANTIGAAESVLRVAATGHDKRLFFKVIVCLYILSSLGRLVSGVTIAYAGNACSKDPIPLPPTILSSG
ncbi:RETICULON-LIKE PROTEIN B22 [Salix koriyanagi]|uniref:RETICULON-LIKE PROTEIN B22 n=1 Tax=Salix koriyanagi TaxID=2511006 RepID=A0A9Q0WJ93_9ROSI|nr:RETICULON-LIKE PROTEIN B22 [Salix koriyanagi]